MQLRSIVLIFCLIISFQTNGQNQKKKINAIIDQLNLIESQKIGNEYTLEYLRLHSIPEDEIDFKLLTSLNSEEELRNRFLGAFQSNFSEGEIDTLHAFFVSSAYKKITDNVFINQAMEQLNSELKEAEFVVSERKATERAKKTKLTKSEIHIVVDRENGIYEIENYNQLTDAVTPALLDLPAISSSGIQTVEKSYSKFSGKAEVILTLTKEGAIKFEEITQRNINKPLAIVVNRKIVSMPVVRNAISMGRLTINADLPEHKIDEIINDLRKGIK